MPCFNTFRVNACPASMRARHQKLAQLFEAAKLATKAICSMQPHSSVPVVRSLQRGSGPQIRDLRGWNWNMATATGGAI